MLPDWFTKPETIYSTCLFILSTIITTIYTVSPDGVKRVVSLPPRRANRWLLERRTYQLKVITRIHNDPYQLILWALLNVSSAIGNILGLSILSGIALLILDFAGKNVNGWFFAGVYATTFGSIFARSYLAQEIIMYLYTYESSRKTLTQEIEELTRKSGAGG